MAREFVFTLLVIGILGQLPRQRVSRFVLLSWRFSGRSGASNVSTSILVSHGHCGRRQLIIKLLLVGALGWTFVGKVSSEKLRARTAGLSAGMGVIFGLTFNTSVPIMRKYPPTPLLRPTRSLVQSTRTESIGATRPPDCSSHSDSSRSSARYSTSLKPHEGVQQNWTKYEEGAPAWKMSKYVTGVQMAQQMRL